MWSMYGQPWEDGIKISIPKRKFMAWAEKIKKVYHVDSTTYEMDLSNLIEESFFKPSISRVAYVEWDNSGKVVQIKCGDNTKNEVLKEIESPILTGLIKDAAWSYEKEIRLRVDLKDKSMDKKVAIEIPDEIIDTMIITTGPRFSKTILTDDFMGVSEIKKVFLPENLIMFIVINVGR